VDFSPVPKLLVLGKRCVPETLISSPGASHSETPCLMLAKTGKNGKRVIRDIEKNIVCDYIIYMCIVACMIMSIFKETRGFYEKK
jgi:hypothetical protein